MSTCQHGQKITKFCASECCQWKEAGGCDSCMRKYHNHMGPTKFLNESQVNDLIKKYVVESNVKPKCRTLQEVIYNYFSRLKTQLSNACDAVSKMTINQIGYPYLHFHRQLVPYKRLKNKQYKKLMQKDFRSLVQATNKRDFRKFPQEEAKIYFENLDKIVPLINEIDKLFSSFERISKQLNAGYSHDHAMISKINEIVKNVRESRSQQNANVSQNHNISNNVNPVQSNPTPKTQSKQYKQQALNTNRATRDRLKEVNNQLQLPAKKDKDRKISIDKNFKKSRLNKDIKRLNQKDTSITIKEPTVSTEIYNNKEQEINQKKQKLISLMKQKESNKEIRGKADSISTKKESLKTQPPALLTPKVQPLSNKKTFKQKKGSQHDIILGKQTQQKSKSSINDLDKSKGSNFSDNSGSSENLKQSPLNVPHGYLPRVQSRKKIFQDSAEIFRKTYIVPVQAQMNKNQSIDQCQSPLMRKKKKMTNASGSPKDGFKMSDASKSPSPNKEQKIKDNQEKSLALLVKSLGMKAEEAIPHLESALRHADNNLSAAQYLSYLLLQIGRPKQCLILCNKMLQKLQNSNESDQLSLNLNNNKTAALNILGRYSQSIVILQKCLVYKQKDTLYKNLADAYFSIGIYQKAIYNYEKAVQLYEEYDQAHYNLAVCLFIQQNYYNAKLAITRALDYAPKNPTYIELKNHINQRIQLL